jgi:hypothetical protein
MNPANHEHNSSHCLLQEETEKYGGRYPCLEKRDGFYTLSAKWLALGSMTAVRLPAELFLLDVTSKFGVLQPEGAQEISLLEIDRNLEGC